MGQGISCASLNNHGDDIFKIAELGDLAALKSVIDEDPQLLYEVSLYDRNSLLHVAASNGQIDVGFLFFIVFFVGFCKKFDFLKITFWVFDVVVS